jgi:dihydrofolate reductase
MFNIIVAMCKKSRGIGFKDKLPFKSSKDLKRFKKITIGSGNNSVIMGSKTWLSLPFLTRPLKHRENIVLSRTKNKFDLTGKGYLLNNIELIEEFCKKQKFDENWIIGGGEIYKKALEMGIVKKIYITEIDEEYECDTFFPEIDYSYFELISSVKDGKLTFKKFGKKIKKVNNI